MITQTYICYHIYGRMLIVNMFLNFIEE